MKLKERLSQDMKQALKERNTLRLSTVRLLLAAIQTKEIAKGKHKGLEESEIIDVLTREARKRKESITEYTKGGREDLVRREARELEIIEEYLPEELTPEELQDLVEETIREVGAQEMKDLGKVMSTIMPKVRGRADGKIINRLVRAKLNTDKDG